MSNIYQSILDDLTTRLSFDEDIKVFLRKPFADETDTPAIFIVPSNFSIDEDNGLKVKGPFSINLLLFAKTFSDLLDLLDTVENKLDLLSRVPNTLSKIKYVGWQLADKQATGFACDGVQMTIRVSLTRDKNK